MTKELTKEQISLHEGLIKGWGDVVSASVASGASVYHPKALSIVASMMSSQLDRSRGEAIHAYLSLLKQSSKEEMAKWVRDNPIWHDIDGNIDRFEQERVARAFDQFSHEHWFSGMVEFHELNASLMIRSIQERANELRGTLMGFDDTTLNKVDKNSLSDAVKAVDALTEEINRVMTILDNSESQVRLADF